MRSGSHLTSAWFGRWAPHGYHYPIPAYEKCNRAILDHFASVFGGGKLVETKTFGMKTWNI